MVTPELAIDIRIDAGDWPAEADLHALIQRTIFTAIKAGELSILPDSELSILLTNDDNMRAINGEWRGIEKPTNVLSFPSSDVAIGDQVGPMLGDIICSFETLDREAMEAGISFESHFSHLIIHGLLHLFGYDHETDMEAEQMETLETSILDDLGIADPYR